MIIATIVLLASAGVAITVYVTQYRIDTRTDKDAASSAVTAASEGTVALLSYAPETLDGDLASAKSHLTGNFLGYYTKFTDEVIKPAATGNGVTTTAAVVKSGISEIQPKSAKVLVFLNQTTMSKDRSEPAQTASMVMVTLAKSNGTWLISDFTPV